MGRLTGLVLDLRRVVGCYFFGCGMEVEVRDGHCGE